MKYDRKYISTNEEEIAEDNFIKIIANKRKENDYSMNIFQLKQFNEKYEEIYDEKYD